MVHHQLLLHWLRKELFEVSRTQQRLYMPLAIAGNVLNAVLDPILIFVLGFGISGAAAATVISEYLIAFILLWKLNENVVLLSPQIKVGRANQYLKSGNSLKFSSFL
jgi:Na+-driven multidrug efflux pump